MSEKEGRDFKGWADREVDGLGGGVKKEVKNERVDIILRKPISNSK